MTTPTAKIVDLEAHRRLRGRSTESVPTALPVFGFAMVMVPVAFVMFWSPLPFMQGTTAAAGDGSFSAA